MGCSVSMLALRATGMHAAVSNFLMAHILWHDHGSLVLLELIFLIRILDKFEKAVDFVGV